MAYNEIMNVLAKEHESYVTTNVIRTKTAKGDLGRMLYPYGGELDWESSYEYEPEYKYITDTKSVEDAWIATENGNKQEVLLMYRDSFGNTLLPFFAEEYKEAYFSKATPYAVEKNMIECKPDTVIIECVERNIRQFATQAAIISGTECIIDKIEESGNTASTISVQRSELDLDYMEIKGHVEQSEMKNDDSIYVSVKVDDNETIYEAFTISDDTSDYGYLLYLPVSAMEDKTVEVSVLTGTEQKANVVVSDTVTVTAENM